VAFCPCPPLLVPELSAGASVELDALRASCDAAVARLLVAGPARIAVLVGASAGHWPSDAGGSMRPYGVDVHAGGPGVRLPIPLTIGAWLLDRSGWDGPRRYVGVGGEPPAADVREAWLVLGDGSARRADDSPGQHHPLATGFDEAVARALAEGDAAALAGLDLALAEQLWCAGAGVWRAVGSALQGRVAEASLLLDQAPYGVGYLVATWITMRSKTG
jgi:hypothetical protein